MERGVRSWSHLERIKAISSYVGTVKKTVSVIEPSVLYFSPPVFDGADASQALGGTATTLCEFYFRGYLDRAGGGV